MPNLLLSLTQKKKDFYIPQFKRNNEELKANIARIDKGKNSDVNTCKVEFYQPSCWLYFVSNLLVF